MTAVEQRESINRQGERYMTVEDVLDELGIHRATLYRYQKAGGFVPLKRAGDRRTYYARSQVDHFKELHPKDGERL